MAHYKSTKRGTEIDNAVDFIHDDLPALLDTKADKDDVEAALGSKASASDVATLYTRTGNLLEDLQNVRHKIPNQATSENQLADKAFVNSSIATETAHYISDNGRPFESEAALKAYTGTKTNNDYAFVKGIDEGGNGYYARYKYSSALEDWSEEFVLNNSSFTAEQWEAINSGITTTLVSKLSNIDLSQYYSKTETDTKLDLKMSKSNPTGTGSFAVGDTVSASGSNSHAEGRGTTASGDNSHAEGVGTIAGEAQHVEGTYNIEDTNGDYIHIVGNGGDDSSRSNAHTLDWDGNAWFAGDVIGHKDNQEHKLSDKVDKINGKGLSTNDYTNEDKTKLADTYTKEDTLSLMCPHTETMETIIDDAITHNALNYTIYGNSIQNAIPDPTNPVPIKSVGDLVTDTEDEHYGEYVIPVKIYGKNIVDQSTIDMRNVTLPDESVTSRAGFAPIYLKSGTYTLSCDGIATDFYINGVNTVFQSDGINTKGGYVTIPSDGIYILRSAEKSINAYNQKNISQVQFERGSTATSYEAYREPEVVNIYLDEPLRSVGSGEDLITDYIDYENQKVIRNISSLDMGTLETWTYQEQNNRFAANITNIKVSNNRWANWVSCSVYKAATPLTVTNNSMSIQSSSLFVWDFRYNDAASLKRALNGITLYYGLKNPIEQSCLIESMELHEGTNIITFDTEIQPSIKIKYYQDINKVLEKTKAELQALILSYHP